MESRITTLGRDRPYYRGRDALELAAGHRFEEVAEWLWCGELTSTAPWRCPADAVAAARAVQAGLPAGLLPLDRLQVAVTALAISDPMRFQRDPAVVAAIGRTLIAGMVEALPALSDPVAESISALLWSRLSPRPPSGEPELRLVDTALILLADHELAASTFAARVAASVRADPYAVVGCGLGVLGGPMHGGSSPAVERMLAEIAEPALVPRVIGDRLRRGERIPGFGHTVYKNGDARGTHLWNLLRPMASGHPAIVLAEAVRTELRSRRLPEFNCDFPLAVLGIVFGMVPGAGETLFAVARTAGWLAHALEEYASGVLIRPRAITPPIS
ncbi:citrate/2-methylcitrate synthase [Nocardia jiangxiensis]|uniref:citrate synthase (unknown stereospecificity) n=1 Tax=Nocardia jiangxiensis TaxID=282685 RepID=A0ABW6RZ00_9NOCA